MARYPTCDSSRGVLHHLQHFSSEKATTYRRIHPSDSRYWAFRNHCTTLGLVTKERRKNRAAHIQQWW